MKIITMPTVYVVLKTTTIDEIPNQIIKLSSTFKFQTNYLTMAKIGGNLHRKVS